MFPALADKHYSNAMFFSRLSAPTDVAKAVNRPQPYAQRQEPSEQKPIASSFPEMPRFAICHRG